jgi:hypothetical protein
LQSAITKQSSKKLTNCNKNNANAKQNIKNGTGGRQGGPPGGHLDIEPGGPPGTKFANYTFKPMHLGRFAIKSGQKSTDRSIELKLSVRLQLKSSYFWE